MNKDIENINIIARMIVRDCHRVAKTLSLSPSVAMAAVCLGAELALVVERNAIPFSGTLDTSRADQIKAQLIAALRNEGLVLLTEPNTSRN